jgi:hypothetical protein
MWALLFMLASLGPAVAGERWYPTPGGGEINDPEWAAQMWRIERQTEEAAAERDRQRLEERLRDLERATKALRR